MADLTITAASVVPGSNAKIVHGTAGETITAGKAVYKSGNTWLLADSNSSTAAARVAQGIALTGSSASQPVSVQTGGDITMGATMTPGVAYYLSDTPGGICPVADQGSGEYTCIIGAAKSTTVLAINIQAVNVAL